MDPSLDPCAPNALPWLATPSRRRSLTGNRKLKDHPDARARTLLEHGIDAKFSAITKTSMFLPLCETLPELHTLYCRKH
jgi:hypothetical protein